MSSDGTINQNEYKRAIQQATARGARLERLQEQFDAVVKERDQLRTEFDQLKAEHDQLAVEADEALTLQEQEIEELKGKYADAPSQHLEELKALRHEKAERTHDGALLKAAKSLDIDERYYGDLRKLVGYEATDAEPDEAGIQEMLKQAISSRDWLVKQAPESGAGTSGQNGRGEAADAAGAARTTPPQRGAGASRGGSPKGDQVGLMRVNREQLSNPEFMRANQGKIAEASRAGMFSIED